DERVGGEHHLVRLGLDRARFGHRDIDRRNGRVVQEMRSLVEVSRRDPRWQAQQPDQRLAPRRR
ncbi:MAG TPA: hypothetical protein VK898_20510, partial [Chloroflexota bacterium]|nr:hypothetical protein [Chloroflexota bacterium]